MQSKRITHTFMQNVELASVFASFTSNSFLTVIHSSVMNWLGFSSLKCKLLFFPVIFYHPSYKLALGLKK